MTGVQLLRFKAGSLSSSLDLSSLKALAASPGQLQCQVALYCRRRNVSLLCLLCSITCQAASHMHSRLLTCLLCSLGLSTKML